MKINKKQQNVRRNLLELRVEIQQAIDIICEKHDFKITYAEINTALTNVLKDNIEHELKELWEQKK